MNQLQAFAKSEYKFFLDKEGSDYIASDYALYTLLRVIKKFKIQSVLEVGVGIGCIVHTVLKYADENNTTIKYEGTEANDFCLKVLNPNLGKYVSKFKLYPFLKDVNAGPYELVIVDGTDSKLEAVAKLIAPNGIVFIEGGRADQVNALLKIFPNSKAVQAVSGKPNPKGVEYTTDRWRGGGTIIFVNPNATQKIIHFQERVSNSFKFRVLRKFNKKK
jgi:hypothetical protein